MNSQTFRRFWLRSHESYQKRAYRILKRTFKQLGKNIPFEQLTEQNYSELLNLTIPQQPIKDAYVEIYLQIGLIHGNKIGRAFNKDIKEFVPSAFLEEYRRQLYAWILQNLGQRITSVHQEYIKYINEIIANGLSDGKGIMEVSRQIQKLVNRPDFYSWQSMRIARTEATAAANNSAVNAATSAGVLYEKVWISANDARVRRHPKSRFDHLEMHLKTVLKDGYFNVDGEMIAYPGALVTQSDKPTSPQNIINCRCAVAVRPKRDRNGRLIRTGTTPQPRIPLQQPIQQRPIINIQTPRLNSTLTYKPATSIKEAKQMFVDKFKENGITVDSVSVARDLKLDNLNKMIKQFYYLSDKYKTSPLRNGSNIKLKFSTGRGLYGQVRYYNRSSQPTFGKVSEINFGEGYDSLKGWSKASYYNNRIGDEEYNKANLFSLRGKSITDRDNFEITTLTHEFAHYIEVWETSGGYRNPFWQEMREISKSYGNELEMLNKNRNFKGYNDIFLGKYAGTKLDEFLAEAFAEFELRSNPSKYAKLVGELVLKYFGK